MNTDSSPLFLFLHDTDSSDDKVFDELKRSAKERHGVTWEAGNLTVRQMLPSVGKKKTKAAPSFSRIVTDTDIFSPQLVADLTCIECKSLSERKSKTTFRRQLYEVTLGAALLLSSLCLAVGVLGFCAFLIGVAIPFGLFS